MRPASPRSFGSSSQAMANISRLSPAASMHSSVQPPCSNTHRPMVGAIGDREDRRHAPVAHAFGAAQRRHEVGHVRARPPPAAPTRTRRATTTRTSIRSIGRQHGVDRREHGDRQARRQQHPPLADPVDDAAGDRPAHRRRVGEEAEEQAGGDGAAAEVADRNGAVGSSWKADRNTTKLKPHITKKRGVKRRSGADMGKRSVYGGGHRRDERRQSLSAVDLDLDLSSADRPGRPRSSSPARPHLCRT